MIKTTSTGFFNPEDIRELYEVLGITGTYPQTKEETVGVRIERVIFSGPATIVFWEDGDKTIVKCMDGDPLNYEMGIAMCTLKKLFGEEGYRKYKKHVKELLSEEKVEKEVKENENEKV